MICLMVITLSSCIISVLGLIGNIIAFRTFGKMESQNASTTLLRFLAVVDSSLLLLVLLSAVLSMFYQHDRYFSYVSMHCILPALYAIARTSTIWTPVLIGLQRYIAVCKPLLASSMCTVGNARKQFVCVLVFSVIVNVPQFFTRKIDGVISEDGDSNVTYVVNETPLAKSPWYNTGYDKVIRIGLVNYAIPVVSLAFITVNLLQSLRSYRQRRISMTGGHSRGQEDRGVDRMIIVVVVVFIICHTGYPIGTILDGQTYAPDTHEGLFCIMFSALLIFTLLNSSVNCLIYIAFNRQFRQILCPCGRGVCYTADGNRDSRAFTQTDLV